MFITILGQNIVFTHMLNAYQHRRPLRYENMKTIFKSLKFYETFSLIYQKKVKLPPTHRAANAAACNKLMCSTVRDSDTHMATVVLLIYLSYCIIFIVNMFFCCCYCCTLFSYFSQFYN